MVERDPLERRGYAATIPTDLADPPQFGQVTEVVKDALVLELKTFFNQPRLNTTELERRREIPTVRKYAVGYDADTDPYATTQKILEDFADAAERLPHVAVTAVQGGNNRLTAGQPFIGHVQLPPRVATANAEPYALGASAAESWRVVVAAAVAGVRLAITILDQDFAYVVQPGDTTQNAARGLRDALRDAEPYFRVTRSGSTLDITAAELNTPFTPVVSAGLTATQTRAAGIGTTDQLVIRTTPDRGQTTEVDTITFRPDRFAAAAPATAARAEDVARVFNEQAKYAHARVYEVTPGNLGVRFFSGGPSGGDRTPNEVEVLPETSSNLLTVLGLGARGAGAGGDVITGSPPDSPLTLTSAGVGTAATAAVAAGVFAYVHISGHPTESNNGRFRVLSVVSANAITYDNPSGAAASFVGAEWFIGYRDDWRNTTRPMMNRRHLSFKLTATLVVLAESLSERDELHDLVLTQFAYYLELKHFQLLGRGVLDPDAFPDEHYQISLAQDLAPVGQGQLPRAGPDPKNVVHEGRIAIPCTLIMYQDRSVLVPSGPRAGQSYVVTAEDVTPAEDGGAVVND